MNVICVCMDTLRADIVGDGKLLSGCRTPNMDDFWRQGVAFERAFGEGLPTLQTRRAFFTGRRSFPWRYNFDRRGHWHHASGWHKVPPQHHTLAEVLLARGYYTGMVADTYHMFKPTMNFTRGFASYDFVRGQESDNWRGGTQAMIEETMRRHVREPIQWGRHATLQQYLHNMRGREKEEDYLCARVFRSACRWLDDCAANAPFFLWIDSFDPHEAWDPPKKYADEYCPGYAGKDYIFPGAAWEGQQPADAEIERIKALYMGEVTFVDKWVGVLFEKLEELKLWDDTIVVLLSDHGTELMDHAQFGKSPLNLRPYNTRFVWYMRHPGGPKGKVVDAYVQSHDLMPTILAQLDVPYEADGQSVWPLAMGDEERIRDYIITAWATHMAGPAGAHVSVRDDEWAYFCSVHDEEAGDELYNWPTDPEEQSNVRDDHPDVVAKQRRRIEALVGQPLPTDLLEICDLAPAPIAEYLNARGGRAPKDFT
jgi:arylsulfatase A-like enzyme